MKETESIASQEVRKTNYLNREETENRIAKLKKTNQEEVRFIKGKEVMNQKTQCKCDTWQPIGALGN